jgi:hypothetical protein
MNGADLIHRVHNKNGHCCGTIVWESKRTKAWSDGWLQKLKDDLRLVKGDVAVIVSEALPKDIEHFSQMKGIWVTSRDCALNLATALRSQLLEIAAIKAAAVGKNEKMEILYRYLSGPEFKQRIEAIVEAFIGMQEDLNEERRTAERRWSKREKQIQRVICNTSGHVRGFARADRVFAAQHSGPYPSRSGFRGGCLMLCETCRWTGRPGFVRASGTSQEDHSAMIPCPECGGQGIAHCCDGVCEQPKAEPMNESKHRRR